MEDKRPIDKKRNSGGYADIGTPEDGAIEEMKEIGGRLLIIKERAIYEFFLADQIDPDRTNINLPSNVHKLIIDRGSESELVSRTFLTAKTLIRPEFFEKGFDCDRVISLSIELMQELAILDQEVNEYLMEEKKVSDEYESRRDKKGSYSIPSVINLETKCKTFFQKADHFEQILMEVIIIFYPDDGLTKQSHFPKLHQIIESKYGEKDPFPGFLSKTIDFMKIIRSLRNALDHRLPSVKVSNFELQKNSDIISPTIELNHKSEKLDRISLSHFLPIVIENFIDIAEQTFVHLSVKNAIGSFMATGVRVIPEEKRRYKYVRYSFWSPMGEGGYYNV